MTQTRIKQRFDVLSNWLSNDIVLLNGELAVVDCGEQIRFKVGDGTSKFSELLFTDQNQLCTKYIEAEAVSQGIHAGSKPYGMAAGAYLCADASFSQAFGFNSQTMSTDNYSFTWNGDDTRAIGNYYQSHGKGTFNLNALSGIDGIYIGEQTLGDLLSNATGSKITINDRISSIIEERADLSIIKLNALEYAQLVSTSAIISNCLYVVEDSYRDAFGEQIKNVAAPTDLSDAATKGYVDDRVGSIQIPSDLSSFTNSPGYLVSNDISDYYQKSETSSAIEINNAFELSSGNKVFIDDRISSSAGYSDLSIVKLSADEYTTLLTSNQLLSNLLYVVEDGHVDAYGEQIKNVAYPTDLSDAATKEYVDNAVSDVQIPEDLSSFTNSPGYLVSNDISDYYKKSETSSASEINDAIALSAGNKIYIDDRISSMSGYSDLSIIRLSASEYENLPQEQRQLSNALYVVEDDTGDNHGKQIKNLAPGTDLSDAVNLEQLSNAISSIQIPTDLSTFTNSPGYLVSNDISDYYKKSETSSAAEISNALSTKADLSGIEHVVLYEQDRDGDYTAVTIGSRNPNASVGPNSFVNGRNGLATGYYSHAEGYETYAVAYAHAEGGHTSALADTSHAECYYSIAGNQGAHAEGGYTSAFGYASHTEGGWTSTGTNAMGAHAEGGFTRADGPISHVEGIKAIAELSDYQSFVWQGTDYMPASIGDIDPTRWDEYKAHGPGTFNINPVSGAAGVYIGEQSLASMLNGVQSVEWADLTSLVQTSSLNPGMKYRITDYMTKIDQEDCRSAEHPFDLIVTAIDHHTLDENARATIHEGDDYFAARPFHVPDYQQYLEYARVPLESWEIKYCLDNDKMRFKFADTENGKGVIYWMKDEFGNEAPYDFKNVQFRRYKITSSPGASGLEGTYGLAVGGIEVDTSDEMWCYTFNGADYANFGLSEPYDFSGWHVRPTQAVLQQFGGPSIERLQECTGNVIQARQDDSSDFSLMSFKLPNNVFHCALNITPVDELPFLKIGYCIGNRLGLNCYDNTFGDSQLFNVLGDLCDSNTFGSNCDSNTFGSNCNYNTFGSDCNSNTFGSDCGLIKFASTSTSEPSQAKSYYKFITIDSGNQCIILNRTQSTYSGNEYKNVRILPGVNNSTTYKMITDNNVNQSFCTTYQPANSQVIAI